MPSTADPQHSLFTAIDRLYDRPQPHGPYKTILTKYLAPDEIVHLAFRGNGWTFMDPMLIITDRRILRLRDLGFGKWSKRGEVAARDVLGASVNRRFLFGTVEIHLRNGQALRVQYTTDTEADTFVDGLNRLIGR